MRRKLRRVRRRACPLGADVRPPLHGGLQSSTPGSLSRRLRAVILAIVAAGKDLRGWLAAQPFRRDPPPLRQPRSTTFAILCSPAETLERHAEYERPVNSWFTAAQHRRTASSGCCRIREGEDNLQVPLIGSRGEPQSMAAARIIGCASGCIRTLMRQLAHGWVWDSSSLSAWVVWVRV